ncbi:hypothetical protein CYMTET_30383 [Cymbomonas tetramitiformis]|uniref:Uncharacterized protein n=1 Tax=Cymbomonas tetramitiformis TaxID=36881 RepID=A0AAE0KTZ9_9CHLO|nr:hypothetical protein CYMTET_30383 [Cymbomonas tetramitiformis]
MSQRGAKYKGKDGDEEKYGKGKPPSLARNSAGPLERGRKPTPKAKETQAAKPAAPKKPEFNADNLKHKFDMLSRKAEGDDLKFDENKVKNVMDKLAFNHQTKEVKSALWGFGTGLTQETEATMMKAQETLHLIAASKHAAKWVPSEVSFAVKATYIKVSTEAVNRLKFYEHNKALLREAMCAVDGGGALCEREGGAEGRAWRPHAVEKQQILDENQGLRQMLKPYISDIEESSALVKDLRETEDGINRALLMSAHTEIVRLKSREVDLEKQLSSKSLAARGLAAAKGDTKGENELKEEIVRLEEKSSRLQWMLGEKETEIEDLRSFYTASKAYELQEELQEVCETLDGTVAALQAMDAASKQDMAEFQEDFEGRVEDMEDQIATLEEDLDKVRGYVKECEVRSGLFGESPFITLERPPAQFRTWFERGWPDVDDDMSRPAVIHHTLVLPTIDHVLFGLTFTTI